MDPGVDQTALITELRAQIGELQDDKAELERKLKRFNSYHHGTQKRYYENNKEVIRARQKANYDRKKAEKNATPEE